MSEPAETDALADALRSALRGDERGFVTIYRMLHPGLLRYATVLIGADAEDATAEAWARETLARATAQHPSRREAQEQLADSPWSVSQVIVRLKELWAPGAQARRLPAPPRGGRRG